MSIKNISKRFTFFVTAIFASCSILAQENSYEYVDLGLSVKWATKNVGAKCVTDYGNFYAWAETSSKDEYYWTTYKYSEKGATKMTKYCFSDLGSVIDFLSELEANDDAATINWGKDWRTPSLSEMNELMNNCTWTWHNNYNGSGIAGYIVSSNIEGYTEKFIFLPAAGHYGGKNHYDGDPTFSPKGMYWTSTLNRTSFASTQACQIYFENGSLSTMSYDRQIGMTIRPVYGEKPEEQKDYDVSGKVQGHDYVDLGLSVQWATCNIGVDNPKLGGNLYSWGETETKDTYRSETYSFGHNGSYSNMTKYNKSDGLTRLEAVDDAATVNWGDEWRTPTIEEIEELISGCEWYSGKNCLYGISKANENVIILSMVTGCRSDPYDNRTTDGYYWSADRGLDVQFAYARIFRAGAYNYTTRNVNRYQGYAIRPVLKTIHDNNGQTDIDRGTPPLVPGDANSDGLISVADLSLMASYILGEEADINIVNSDINGDGKITVADLSNVASIILGAN